MKINLNDVINFCNGKVLNKTINNVDCYGAKVDSREVQPGDIFFSFSGEHCDGNNFISSAIDKGAVCVICENMPSNEAITFAMDNNANVVLVDSAMDALQNIAKEWRKMLTSRIIGITGSYGKTSTRKMVYDVLKTHYKCTTAQKNQNNELGLPITVCSSNLDDDVLVLEMGMYNAGEITDLCNISYPEWGIITNIGQCHIEFLKTQENIAKAKSELALAIPDNIGKMFLRADDEYRDYIIQYAKLEERKIDIIIYGSKSFDESYAKKHGGVQIWYENLTLDNFARPEFELCYMNSNDGISEQRSHCKMLMQGEHSAINACCAAAVGITMGMSLNDCVNALEKTTPESGRQEILKASFGATIINDAYNANPQSMIASLKMLDKIESSGNKIAVLGNMGELGDQSVIGHTNVGKTLTKTDVDILITVGDLAGIIADTVSENPGKCANIIKLNNIKEAEESIRKYAGNEDIILLKASNSMRFFDIAENLKE